MTCKAPSTPSAFPAISTVGQLASSKVCNTRMLSISSSTNTVRIICVHFGVFRCLEFEDDTRTEGLSVPVFQVGDGKRNISCAGGIHHPDALCRNQHPL